MNYLTNLLPTLPLKKTIFFANWQWLGLILTILVGSIGERSSRWFLENYIREHFQHLEKGKNKHYTIENSTYV